MVEESEPDRDGGGTKLGGECGIRCARLKAAAGMVVGDRKDRAATKQNRLEYLGDLDLYSKRGSFADENDLTQSKPTIRNNNDKSFEGAMLQLG